MEVDRPKPPFPEPIVEPPQDIVIIGEDRPKPEYPPTIDGSVPGGFR